MKSSKKKKNKTSEPTDAGALHGTLVATEKTIKDAREALEHLAVATVKNMFIELFNRFPQVYGVRWAQYTPEYNDGEPCEHRQTQMTLLLTSTATGTWKLDNGTHSDLSGHDGPFYEFDFGIIASEDRGSRNDGWKTLTCQNVPTERDWERAVGGPNYQGQGDNLFSDEECGPLLTETWKELCELYDSGGTVDLLRNLLGTNRSITVTRTKLFIEDYNCGY